MPEPCHRHSRADSALHGDECAQCLRADLAQSKKHHAYYRAKVSEFMGANQKLAADLATATSALATLREVATTLRAERDAARAGVEQLRTVLNNLWKIVPPNKARPELVRQVEDALAATAKP